MVSTRLVVSYGAEGFGGGHAGGAQGGQQAGDGADDEGGGDAAGPGGGGDDDGPVLGGGINGGGGRAGRDPGGAAEDGEQDGFGQELGADLPPGSAEGTPEADLGPALQDRDDHDVGDSDAPDQQRHRAEAEEQAVERALGRGAGDQRGRGATDLDAAGGFGVGGGGEDLLDGGDLVGGRAHVDGGRMPVETEVLVRGGEPDQHRGVDLGGEHRGPEDPGDVEPLAADPDPFPGPDAVDAEAGGGGRAEHGDGLGGGGRVEVAAVGEAGAHREGEPGAGRLDRQRVGIDRGDQRAAVGVGAVDDAGVGDLCDRPDPADHPRSGRGQFGGLPEDGLPVGDGEQVGAQPVDLGQQPGLRGGRQPEHGHDGGHPDGDAQRRQGGPQPAGPQSGAGHPDHVGGPQPFAGGRGDGHDCSSGWWAAARSSSGWWAAARSGPAPGPSPAGAARS